MWGTCGLAWMVRCSKPLLQQSSTMCVECMVRRSKLDSAKFEYKWKTKMSAERADVRCSDVWWDVLGWLDSAKFESDECWNRVNVLSLPKQSSNKQPKAEQNLRGGHLTKRWRRLKVAPLRPLFSFEILFYSLLLLLLLLLMMLLIASAADVWCLLSDSDSDSELKLPLNSVPPFPQENCFP